MKSPDTPENETERQAALDRLNLVDTALEERFERVTRLASRLLGVPISAISLIDGDRQWFKSLQGWECSQTSRDISFCGHAILGDGPFIIEDATKDERFADNPGVTGDPHIRFYAGCPVKSPDGFVVGTLCVIDKEPRKLSDTELEDLKDLAAMVEVELRSRSMLVAQMRMTEELRDAKRAVLVDPLTRLWNRSGGEEFLARQHQHAVERGEQFCIAMLDIDYFKKINDTYGHDAGDEVLRIVAKRLLKAIGDSDFVCRNGGEEFLMILGGSNPQAAEELAERVRLEVADEPVAVDGQSIPVTISIGLAFFDPAGQVDYKTVIKQADRCLYEAKGGGRNRVVAHLQARDS